MKYGKKNLAKFSASVAGVMLMALVASRQFYLFVSFKNARGLLDTQGGSYHLWFAIGAILIACVAGFFMFSISLRHERDDFVHITS